MSRTGELSDWLRRSNTFALDLETTDLGKGAKILSAAITGESADEVAFVEPQLLSELMDAPKETNFIFHNAPFDLKHLAWNGVALHSRYPWRDTLILSHLANENGDHSLGALVKEYFNDDYKAEFKAAYKQVKDAPKEALIEYNAKDVHYTHRLQMVLTVRLESEGVPLATAEHAHALQRALLATEIAGIRVDTEYLLAKGVELKTRLEGLAPRMREAAKDAIEMAELDLWLVELGKRKTDKGKAGVEKPTFSFDSPKQLLDLLYNRLELPVQKNEKTKQPSCDWDSLEKIKDRHEVVRLIQEYREYTKVYGTYIQGTLEKLVDGRIYPSFNVCGTATGRISHSNPNLGQLPRSGGIRGIYIPDDGYVFISADYAQLEVCISAHFTRDPSLLRIVEGSESQHDITAKALGIDRNTAKTVNFACQYGAGAFKLAKTLGVSLKEGERAYEKYWKTYAGQKRVMDECARKVDSGEPIINPFGRRRRFEQRQRQPWDSAYRQAWNALVQGTGADCTSRAFYLADERLSRRGIGRALFTVHDEIIITAREEAAEEAQEILVQAMLEVGEEIGLTVKLKAEPSGACARWED